MPLLANPKNLLEGLLLAGGHSAGRCRSGRHRRYRRSRDGRIDRCRWRWRDRGRRCRGHSRHGRDGRRGGINGGGNRSRRRGVDGRCHRCHRCGRRISRGHHGGIGRGSSRNGGGNGRGIDRVTRGLLGSPHRRSRRVNRGSGRHGIHRSRCRGGSSTIDGSIPRGLFGSGGLGVGGCDGCGRLGSRRGRGSSGVKRGHTIDRREDGLCYLCRGCLGCWRGNNLLRCWRSGGSSDFGSGGLLVLAIVSEDGT